jgi:Ca2+-binding RTX toxin-like protein
VDSTTDVITENANEGTDTIQSSVTFTIASLANIEKLTLTGSSVINGTGNAANNILTGNSANNTLNGGAGVDTLIGGLGNDIYQVDSTTDVITENANEGTDTIQSSVTYTIASLANIENLTLTGSSVINGTGNTGNNVLTGNTANNTLNGGDGNDTLNGGAGNDSLIGGNGNDYAYYYSSTASVTVNLATGTASDGLGGTDTLSQIENVQGSNTAGDNITGSTGNNVLYGYGGNDILNGGDGNDTLIGGTGNDSLIGGNGNDYAYYYSATGVVTVNLGTGTASDGEGGTDTLSQIENVQGSNTAGDNITGSTGNNVLYGYGGNDTLNGGAGNDSLIGGLGNDIYQVDSTTDVITENASEGTDTIQSSVTFTIASLANIENLTLTGSSVINGTGNAANNILTGNSANNTLNGGDGNDTLNGGAGNDSLIGGNGNDYAYYYSSTGSVTVNLATGIASDGLGGTDTLSQIENVQGSNTAGDNLTGDANNNILYGYGGNDTLNGGDGNDTLIGGAGNDLLTGGNGTDTAYYYSVTGAVTANLATGTASDGEGGTDTLSQIENVQGSNTASDNLTGNTGVNVLYGYGGADILTGGGGNDLLYLGSDTVKDTVNYTSGDGTDTVYNFVRGASGDLLKFTGITAIDVQVSGSNTLFKVGDGVTGNSGFGTGTLLLTTSATTGFVAADVNVNLLGTTFAFS